MSKYSTLLLWRSIATISKRTTEQQKLHDEARCLYKISRGVSCGVSLKLDISRCLFKIYYDESRGVHRTSAA
eukprot:scaffold63283_cov39-Prasinocladus_malaysianus.AAC.2